MQEFYQVTFRKNLYSSLEQLQSDLDIWLNFYNNERTHQGKMCCGRTPMQTLFDGKAVWAQKNLAQIQSDSQRPFMGNCQMKSELLHVIVFIVSLTIAFETIFLYIVT